MNHGILGMCVITAVAILLPARQSGGTEFERVAIRLGGGAGSVEQAVGEILRERLSEPTGMPVRVERETPTEPGRADELVILLGIPEHHRQLAEMFGSLRLPPLTPLDPGPEGFLVRRVEQEGRTVLLAAGIDPRGALYAAGEILRRVEFREKGIAVPDRLDVRTAPAFEIRGTQYGQSGVARDKAKVRPWTKEEEQRAILDYALAGLNTIQIGEGIRDGDDPTYDFIRSLDLKTLVHYGPNTGAGPAHWQATESIGRLGYLCPSVPEARQALLDRCEEAFSKTAPIDYVRFPGGDGGGCECDACKPYGEKFIHLCADMAAIIRKYHPNAEFFVTNQKFNNEDDIAIFEYLREQPRPWLRAFCYGPGSDAMSWQPGHRQNHRMDLFRYPGFGPFGRYLQEILHQLPPTQDIVFFNEITHWRYSQHGYIQMYPRADKNGDLPPHWNHFIYERRPDQCLTMVYDRLTFFAWPRYYHWVFNQLLRYGIGDCTHSSGTHDHFNQWMWQRLLWAPQTSVEDVVDEYARVWFGPEAAPLMAQALFQLERNLEEDPEEPLAEKEGIDTYYRLVRDAGARMSEPYMRGNWLWRQYAQKAALDKYIQLSVRQQTQLQQRIERDIGKALGGPQEREAVAAALEDLDALRETDEMSLLREEAGRLGEESNALFGVRNEGYYNLEHDFIGLGWLRRQLERSRDAEDEGLREMLGMVVDYEDAGPGGFYDNCGTFNPAPRVVFGYPYDHGQPYVPPMLSEGNRPSQRSMHFTQDEDQGVTFHYTGLDPDARYRVRFTFVRPWYQERYAMRMNQKSQTIYANDTVLDSDVELPLQMSDFFTYDIPEELTRGGELTLRLERAPDVARGSRVEREIWRNSGGWGTLVSEVWLMKR